MRTDEAVRSWRTSLVWSAVFRGVRLLTFGLIGWLWFLSAADFVWKTVSLAALLAVAALVGIKWYVSRARASAQAERQWRVALDDYAQKELAKRTNSRRKFHARPQTKDR
ncbi:MAG TPA: hypothetical protein VGY66_01630 [Gemmataceae bacterium]|nr:hypothetical protein [Gemmataceae bacterium]